MDNDQITLTDSLIDEHKTLRRALSVLKTMTDQVELGTATDRHDVNALLIFLHYFGDVLHQGKEESVLFPALKSSDEFASSSVPEKLFAEHNQERDLIERAQFALCTDKQDEFISSGRQVIALLSEHMDQEERFLFPVVDEMFSVPQAQEVAAKLDDANARFGFRQRTLLMDMLAQLESKYM